jgi:hypothetical protein
MFHFIYKTTSPSGKYYIGRHSTTDMNDGYVGSGKWIRQMKDVSALTVEIIEFAESFESLLELEKQYLAEHIKQPNNMNFNDSPVGFATGELNWNTTPEGRAFNSKRRIGKSFEELYGLERSLEIKEKISKARTGIKCGPSWNSGLDKSDPRIAAMSENISKGVRDWMDTLTEDERKEKFGHSGEQNGFYGKKHSTDTVKHLQQKQQDLRKNNRKLCEHCQGEFDAPNYSRHHGEKCKKKA